MRPRNLLPMRHRRKGALMRFFLSCDENSQPFGWEGVGIY